jgi:hypothetical protein
MHLGPLYWRNTLESGVAELQITTPDGGVSDVEEIQSCPE